MHNLSVNIREAEVAARVAIGKPLVNEAQQMENRSMEVMEAHGLFDGVIAKLIGRAVGNTAANTAAGQPEGDPLRVVA